MLSIPLPRLYPIIDASSFAGATDPTAAICDYGRRLVAAGATLLQYRNKTDNAGRILADARELRRVMVAMGVSVRLIMNDRADLCLAANFDGVHIGQQDLSPASARGIVGDRIVGFSTHNPAQVREADCAPLDYIAVGPVFATSSKQNPDPVIGPEGVRQARALTSKPLVAIGGITRQNCRNVIAAGADSIAVISDLLPDPAKAVKEFLEALGT